MNRKFLILHPRSRKGYILSQRFYLLYSSSYPPSMRQSSKLSTHKMRAASLQKLTQGHRSGEKGRVRVGHWIIGFRIPRVSHVNLLKGKPKHQSHRKAEISTEVGLKKYTSTEIKYNVSFY